MLLLNVSFVTGGPLSWLVWSNPVAIWWSFLVAVSVVNIAFWLLLYGYFRTANRRESGVLRVMVVLCVAYAFGCAFRSILPRADVQRICLFDMWSSSAFIGRSVATVAEVCFAAQWAITLRLFAKFTKSDSVEHLQHRCAIDRIGPTPLLARSHHH